MTKGFRNKSQFIIAAAVVLFIGAGFGAGWLLRGGQDCGQNNCANLSTPLRLGGFKFIQPLLVCDVDPASNSSVFQALEEKITSLVDQKIQENEIKIASVYFRDLKTGEQVDINKDEQFSPASLRKVPLMMTLLRSAEIAPDLLEKKTLTLEGDDQNASQEIKVQNYAKIGGTYSLQELIEKMIKYSDNNAATALLALVGVDNLKSTFDNLQVPFIIYSNQMPVPGGFDFMTTHKFSFFFRVLYNATYLNEEMSEKALQLLGETDFKGGIVAGVPPETTVAHKFGLTTVYNDLGQVTGRELHDCGIVYHPQNPYILCVMTKSGAEVNVIENTIKAISALVYREVDGQKK